MSLMHLAESFGKDEEAFCEGASFECQDVLVM